MTGLSIAQVLGTDAGAPPATPTTPASMPQHVRPAPPQIPIFTPPGWRGHRTQHHGFPMPPERTGGKETVAKFGRYELPHPATGKPTKFPRATSLAHAIDDKAGLIKWLQRTTVLGLKTQPDLLDDIDLFDDPRDVNRSLDKLIDQSQLLAGNSEASERGTAIHAWSEEVECYGLPLDQVPEMFQPKIKAYLEALAEYGITTPPGMVERLVWNPQAEHVGTLDRIWKLADDTLVIGDVKTSKTTSLRYGLLGFAMQTAIYAGAEAMWNPDTEQWEEMPPISDAFSIVAHVPSDRDTHCELITLDLTEGRKALELALEISSMRTNASRTVPGLWDIPKPAQDLRDLVLATRTQAELSALWQAHQDVWNDDLTRLGMEHLRKVSAHRLQ